MTQTVSTLGAGDALANLADQFGQLAMSLADGADEPLTQQRLVEFAVRGVPGAEHASMTVVDGGRPPRTTAQSDELPYQWDQLQYEHGEGPCLEVITTNGIALAQDLRTDTRWPRFARAIVDHTPARSMLSFRLFLTEQNRAALNLYATRPGAFSDQSAATGAMFAAYASMALLAAARHDKANHLARALETNREIGVAMGIIMASGKLTSQQAFSQLSVASQNLNRKLRDIAADVARTGEVPPILLTMVKR
jgi:ANTAR domain/GAF domain